MLQNLYVYLQWYVSVSLGHSSTWYCLQGKNATAKQYQSELHSFTIDQSTYKVFKVHTKVCCNLPCMSTSILVTKQHQIMALCLKEFQHIGYFKTIGNLSFLKGWCHQDDVIIVELIIMFDHWWTNISHCKLHLVSNLVFQMVKKDRMSLNRPPVIK